MLRPGQTRVVGAQIGLFLRRRYVTNVVMSPRYGILTDLT